MSSTEGKNTKNEMMKKIGLTVAATTLTISTLSGCFGSDKKTSSKPKKKAVEKKEDKNKDKKDEKKDEQQDTAKNEFEEVTEKAIQADEVDRVKSVAFLDEFDKKKDKKLIKDKEFENIAMDAKDKSDSNLIAVKNDGKNLVFVPDTLTPNDNTLIASIEPPKPVISKPNPDAVINPPIVNDNTGDSDDKVVIPPVKPPVTPPTGGENGNGGGETKPPTGGENGNGGGETKPPTGGENGNGGGETKPPTGGDGNGGGETKPPTGGDGNDGGGTKPPTGGGGEGEEKPKPKPPVDTEAPTLKAKESITVNVGQNLNPYDLVEVVDNEDPNPLLSIAGNYDTSQPGPITVTVVAIDKAGNRSDIAVTVTVVDPNANKDTEAPVITAKENVTVNVGDNLSVEQLVSVTDNKDENPTVTIGAYDTSQPGTINVEVTAVDKAG
ncbi:adhesin, partial [Bacillus sp. 2SH]|uniref:adhesin n=1 Tax=Bacillus sp. 2SH TaxID=2502202 RepID=UPI00148501B0